MAVKSLKELLVAELRDMYSFEKQITKALPKMSKQASSDKLKDAFDEHLKQTENQIDRLDKIFEDLDMPARAKKCVGMEGIIDEGKELMDEVEDEQVLDAALIAAAQKVEHYEMASYGSAIAYANLLGLEDVVDLLKETLEEEKAADEKLTKLATSEINAEAKRT